MMTTPSIDLNLDVLPSGGLATEAPVGGVPVSGVDGAAYSSHPDVQAVAAFERALAGPIAENSALGEAIQAAVDLVAVGLTRSRGETEVLGENVSSRLQVEVDSRTPPQAPSHPLRASVPPCESSPHPSVVADLTRSRGETEVLGERMKPVSEASIPLPSTSATSAALRETSSHLTPPQAPSHPLRASESPCENPLLPSEPVAVGLSSAEPVAVGLTRRHGETEVLGERMKPVSEGSSPSPSTSATSAALRDQTARANGVGSPHAETSETPHAEPQSPQRVRDIGTPVSAVARVEKSASDALSSVDLVRRPEATEHAEALVAAGVAPPVMPLPVASVASEAPSAPALAPVEVVRTQAAQPLPPAQVLVEAAQAVADTLLVSPGLLRGQGEVVVRLRPDVLEGTEVRIAVTGRQLEVVFQPTTVDMAVLLTNCRTQIATHLAAKIATFNVSVDVRKKRA